MEHLDGVTISLEASGDGRSERRPGWQRIEPEHGEVFGTEPLLPCRVGGKEIIADRPLDCVALGSGKCVEEFEALQQVLVSEPRR